MFQLQQTRFPKIHEQISTNSTSIYFNVIATIILAFIERYSFQTNWYIEACIYMIEYNVKKIFGSYLDIKSLIPTWLFLSYVQFIASEIKSLSNNNIQNCYRLRAASWTKIQFATRNKRRTNNDFFETTHYTILSAFGNGK